MSRYTLELRELIENNTDIGLKNYPIWSEEHRQVLNQKIIDHYKYREIGFETPGRFIDELNIKMNEIMPYYNELYLTTIYDYDPLEVVNYKEEYELNKTGTLENSETGTSTGTGTVAGQSTAQSNNTNNSTGKNVKNDTPQSPLPTETIDNFQHASEIDYIKNQDTNSGSSSSTDNTTTNTNSQLENNLSSESENKETLNKHIYGNYTSTSYQSLIQAQRDIIINIDMKIVDELKNLFMLVY